MDRIKRCVCCICNQDVAKARTRHIGDGKRACKTHDGVLDKADAIYQKQQEQLAKTRQPRPKRTAPDHSCEMSKLRCVICHVETVKLSTLMMESLVVSKELEREGQFGAILLNPTAVLERVKERFPGQKPMHVYGREELTDQEWTRVKRAARYEYQGVLDFFGIAGVCVDCCNKLALPDKMAKAAEKMPPLETLALLGSSVEKALDAEIDRRRGSQ